MQPMERGNKKWCSIFLPEHKQMINELANQEKDVSKPELTEDKLEEINRIFQRSLEHFEPIDVVYYKDKRFHTFHGVITQVNTILHTFKIQNEDKLLTIPLENIVDVK